MTITLTEQVIRILVAFLIGGLIGLERTLARKPAGIRTHSVVCIVCTMLTITSAYGFEQFNVVNRDPARLIANILTGIGFLAGGVIYVVSKGEDKTIKGLTTAAGIWGAAGLGIPIGLGLYELTIVTYIAMELALKAEKLLDFARLLKNPNHTKSEHVDD